MTSFLILSADEYRNLQHILNDVGRNEVEFRLKTTKDNFERVSKCP